MREEEHLILQDKFQKWFGDPVPADVSLPGESEGLDYIPRRWRVNKPVKLSDVILYGFGRAILFGSVIGLIIYILNLSFGGRYIHYWHIQFLVIFLAMVIGFYNGLVKGIASKKRER